LYKILSITTVHLTVSEERFSQHLVIISSKAKRTYCPSTQQKALKHFRYGYLGSLLTLPEDYNYSP